MRSGGLGRSRYKVQTRRIGSTKTLSSIAFGVFQVNFGSLHRIDDDSDGHRVGSSIRPPAGGAHPVVMLADINTNVCRERNVISTAWQ